MRGDIEIEGDLFVVFDELLKCIDEFSTNFGALTKIFGGATSKKKQKEEVSSHYDIGKNKKGKRGLFNKKLNRIK